MLLVIYIETSSCQAIQVPQSVDMRLLLNLERFVIIMFLSCLILNLFHLDTLPEYIVASLSPICIDKLAHDFHL